MNELSWLIYLADMAGSVKFVAIGGAIVIGVGCGVATFVGTMMCCNPWDDDEKKAGQSLRDAWKKWAVCFSATVAIAAITPSQNTIYAIAASEVGERVVSSETGDKAINALNAWLDKQASGDVK